MIIGRLNMVNTYLSKFKIIELINYILKNKNNYLI